MVHFSAFWARAPRAVRQGLPLRGHEIVDQRVDLGHQARRLVTIEAHARSAVANGQ